MIDGLVWSALEPKQAHRALTYLMDLEDESVLAASVVEGKVAKLPFYHGWRLAWLAVRNREGDTDSVLEDVYALWQEDVPPMLLDGSSTPVHNANESESLQLDEAQVPDYVRWFCFAVRADDKPFILFEKAPDKVAARNRRAAKLAEPLTPKGTGEDGAHLYETTVVFTGDAFRAVFAIKPNGEMEMVEDEPLLAGFPAAITPAIPPLGFGPRLLGYLEPLAMATPTPQTPSGPPAAGGRAPGAKAGGRRKRGTSSRPTIIELVELLLERALQDQAKSRLLGYFNASLPSANALQQFTALMSSSSPVVVVETNIPFVDETITEIINALRAPQPPMLECRGQVGTDQNGVEVLTDYALPSHGPAIVMIPLQVYPRVMQVERLAFDIAARDLAAIVTCQRFSALPESLRRYADVILRLPPIDAPTFETLFRRMIGLPPPPDWKTEGTDWVKNLLHTDFEHPRRMQLSRREAYTFVRAQVADRMKAVDPGQGLELSELHGLGEARQFAEDLIADIHAAMAGTLPWSQVDRGALLVGAPGTGKTTLARAIARACGVKFIQASASGWMAEGVSLGPHISAIRKTFSEARDYAPSILFIDEIDSIGNREQFARDNNSVYQTEIVNAILEQIQELDPTTPVFVIGATNHENRVDPALRRAGRLDRVIQIPRPNSDALSQIYSYYIDRLDGGVPVDPALDTLALARLSVGLTGADVERIVRGAARRARKAGRPLGQADVLDEMTNKPRAGSEGRRLTSADIERTATHEAGHALALFLSGSKGADIGFVSIVPRDDGTLGFVAPLLDERVHLTRRDYEDKLEVFVAGRAAEELVYGKDGISSGASSDLQSATALVTQMVTQLGLGASGNLMWSETMSAADTAIAEATLRKAYERVGKSLKRERKRLEKLARALAARQELTGDEVRAIVAA